jgi:hypothetical protein
MTQFRSQERSGSPMFDFAIHDTTGRLKALVEAKRRLGTNGSWAAQFRQNVSNHGRPPPADLFVLIVPDRLYIWQASTPPDARPTYEVDANALLAPYFQRIGVRPEQIEPMAFELLVAWWLEDLAREHVVPAASELSRSGLLDAISGARISHEATA